MPDQSQTLNPENVKSISNKTQAMIRMNPLLGAEPYQEEKVFICDNEFNFLQSKEQYSIRSQKIFDEIFQNSYDNYERSNCPNNYYIKIKIISPREFSIENNGSVFENKEQEIKRIFSTLNTSDNYDEKTRTSSGANGQGAKLVNYLSESFKIENCCNNEKLTCQWKNALSEFEFKKEPIKSLNFFKLTIKFLPKQFQYDLDTNIKKKAYSNLEDMNLNLIRFYVYVMNFVVPFKIHYFDSQLKKKQNQILNKIDIKEFLQIEPEDFISINYKKLKIIVYKPNKILPKQFGIFNGILNFKGGFYASIRQQLIKEKQQTKIEHLHVFVYGNISDKDINYSEQIKANATINISFEPTTSQYEWAKKQIKVPKSKIDPRSILKYTPANYLNQKKHENCTLIITEGDSAMQIFKEIQNVQHDFYNYFGSFPLSGKIENVSEKKEFQSIILNRLKLILNLQENLDYSQDEYFNTLTYKNIIIATDYDCDGFHIKGLFINSINEFWPELIERGYLQEFISPIITCYSKPQGSKIKTFQEFYIMPDYEKFQTGSINKEKLIISDVKYLKGLGSIETGLMKKIASNFQKYIRQIKFTDIIQDKKLIKSLFNKKEADTRKQLILQYTDYQLHFNKDFASLNEIINQVISYSVETIPRAIPDLMDGLKNSQRKIIYYLMQNGKDTRYKVAQLASKVASDLDYHHGETSLEKAIIQLGANYPGSNNYPLIQKQGCFGIRYDPLASASRYLHCKRHGICDLIFNPIDELIYQYQQSDDHQNIEPVSLLPIVPIQLLNGVTGVATGWSSDILSYKIEDIISFIKNYIDDKPDQKQQALQPYYRGYVGKITQTLDQYECKCVPEYNEKKQILKIKDTHIFTQRSKLIEYLKINEITDFTLGEYVQINKCSQQLYETIYKKFCYSKSLYKNITCFFDNRLADQIKEPQCKVTQFKNIYAFFNYWCDLRLDFYQLRQIKYLQKLLQDILKQMQLLKFQQHGTEMIKKKEEEFNIYLNQNYISEDQILITIQQINKKKIQGQVLLDELQKNTNTKGQVLDQCQSMDGDYDYIKNKSVSYFNKLTKNKLIEYMNEYLNLYNQKPQNIWLKDLQNLEANLNKYHLNQEYDIIKDEDE